MNRSLSFAKHLLHLVDSRSSLGICNSWCLSSGASLVCDAKAQNLGAECDQPNVQVLEIVGSSGSCSMFVLRFLFARSCVSTWSHA